MALADIGEGFAALYCLTNLTTCCAEADGGSAGEWFLPGQAQPVISVDSQGAGSAVFTAARGPSAVLLNRRNNAGGPTGIFTCEIPDASGQLRTVYIGVDTGELHVCVCVWGGGGGGAMFLAMLNQLTESIKFWWGEEIPGHPPPPLSMKH